MTFQQGSFNNESHERLIVKSINKQMDQCDWKINQKKNLFSQLTSKSIELKKNLKSFLFFHSSIIISIKILLK